MRRQRFSAGNYEVEAISAGGIETCYRIPALDLLVDIGRCPPGVERHGTLLLTHAHIDHAAGLPYYASLRGLLGMRPPRVFVPQPSVPALRQVIEGWRRLQSDADRLSLTGISPPEDIELPGVGRARAVAAPHRIASVAYVLYARKKRLRRDLVGLSPDRIAELAKGGEAVNETVESAELAFSGDTRIELIDREPELLGARALFLECTFLTDRVPVEKARRSGHVHLDEIAARAERFANERLVLTHFSRRFTNDEIRREVERKLPPDLLARTELLLPHPGE